MVFKSPLTGVIGTSNSGGAGGSPFKAAGYDALVIKGRGRETGGSTSPRARSRSIPAGHLWGKDIHATTDELTAGFAAADRPRVLCIGPAGENLVRFADVANDQNRVYGRGGPGAVWGAKNLKAIRVAGREKIQIRGPGALPVGIRPGPLPDAPGPGDQAPPPGTGHGRLVELINVIDMLPHRNFQDCTHRDEDLERISGETIAKTILERAGRLLSLPDRLSAAHPDRPGRDPGRARRRARSTRPSS